ncbi:MAG: anthrone oxygenase family protein [Chitinophagales bacterium]
MTTYHLIQVVTVVLTGLIAGLLYGYDCSVIRGLGHLPDKEYLKAFQSINRAIVNPCFLISFIGSLFMLPIASWLNFHQAPPFTFYVLLSAAIVYTIGVFGITILGNVPLNNLLEDFDISAAPAEMAQAMRQKFEARWNVFHHVRTYAAMVSFLLSVIALVKK